MAKNLPDMDQVYREHSRLVYRYLLSRTGDPDLSEELTQETFCRAVKSSQRFDGSCQVSTWLIAIAKNLLKEEARRHPPQSELTPLSAESGPAEGEALARLAHLTLLQRLHALAEPAREVVYLRSFGGLSFREIGQVLGASETWARVTFYRAKERLKKEMEKDEK